MALGEVYLVRHGLDRNSELTPMGREQGLAAATLLATIIEPPSVPTMLSSRLLRAGQTAEIIARQFHTKVIVSAAVGEAGKYPSKVREFVPFLENCLSEAGVEYDETTPLIVVTHWPMIAAATGLNPIEIDNGRVDKYDGHTWSPTLGY